MTTLRRALLATAGSTAVAALLMGCGEVAYYDYGPALCAAMGGESCELTQYRSKKGGWVLVQRYCAVRQEARR